MSTTTSSQVMSLLSSASQEDRLSILSEAINTLDVQTLIQLMNNLGTSWGIDPQSVAASSGPSASVNSEAESEEPTSFELILSDMGANKVNVIKAVREFTTLGLGEAKTLVETGGVVASGLTKEKANEALEKMKAAGATCKVQGVF